MPITAEDRARHTIDRLLTDAGWLIQSRDETNINAARGVAIREFPLKSGYGEADYLLHVDVVPAGSDNACSPPAIHGGIKMKAEEILEADHIGRFLIFVPNALNAHRYHKVDSRLNHLAEVSPRNVFVNGCQIKTQPSRSFHDDLAPAFPKRSLHRKNDAVCRMPSKMLR